MEIPEGIFKTSIRVYFVDTDAAGVVHHSRYIVWLERGRIEYLDSIGTPYEIFQDQKIGLVPVNIDMHYIKPFRFGDHFDLGVRMTQLGHASLIFESYFIKDDTLHAYAKQKLACMDEANWKILPVPELIRKNAS